MESQSRPAQRPPLRNRPPLPPRRVSVRRNPDLTIGATGEAREKGIYDTPRAFEFADLRGDLDAIGQLASPSNSASFEWREGGATWTHAARRGTIHLHSKSSTSDNPNTVIPSEARLLLPNAPQNAAFCGARRCRAAGASRRGKIQIASGISPAEIELNLCTPRFARRKKRDATSRSHASRWNAIFLAARRRNSIFRRGWRDSCAQHR